MPRRSFVICPVGHVQVPGSSFPFPIPHSHSPYSHSHLLFSFSSSASHSCSSSPRLIALISSDSDYCCLRIVQLMCELRHCLKRRSTTRIRFRLRLATKLSSRIGIDFKCECETSTILVWMAGCLSAPGSFCSLYLQQGGSLLAPKYDVMAAASAQSLLIPLPLTLSLPLSLAGSLPCCVSRNPKKGNF